MKIKEKGLTGNAAVRRRELIGRQGFNAFKLMEGGNHEEANGGDNKKGSKPKPEIYLEFMGKKLRVHEDDGGKVEESDIPYVKGSALKFSCKVGDEGVRYEVIKVRVHLFHLHMVRTKTSLCRVH